jgi:hypothetical protein
MKCVCPMGGDRTCPDDCPLAVWAALAPAARKAQRKPIAEKLYKQGFTQEQIATQLGVSQALISGDLVNLSAPDKLKPAKTASNPKGAGRPKGSKTRKVPRRVTGNDVDTEASAEDRKRQAGANQERENARDVVDVGGEPSGRDGKTRKAPVKKATPADATKTPKRIVIVFVDPPDEEPTQVKIVDADGEECDPTPVDYGRLYDDYQELEREFAKAWNKRKLDSDGDDIATIKDLADAKALTRTLRDINSDLVAALNAKEKEAARDWPANMTPKQIKLRDKCLKQIAEWQLGLEQLYNEVTGQPPWRVELIKKDGARFNNGARLATRGEAEAYGQAEAREEEGKIEFEVLSCEGEKANVECVGSSIRRFSHDDCDLLDWHLIGPKQLPPAGNGVDTNISAETMKAKHNELLADDNLSIPASLRRSA